MANTLLDDLVAHWSFDNTANDSHSAGPYNMTLVNSPIYTTTPTPPSAWTYALRTASVSSQYAYTADGAQWDVLAGTGEWSVGFWFYTGVLSGTEFMFNSWSASASTRSWIVYRTGTTIRLRVEVSDTAYDTDWSTGISGNTWYCVQVWRSGDSTYISLDNGTPVSTSLGAGASIDSWDQPPTWGARANSPLSYFSGYCNGLSVWGADIGATNRTEFYQSGTGLAYGSWSASGGGGLSIPVAMNSYRQRRV